jgi:gliding motility-associated-like protein
MRRVLLILFLFCVYFSKATHNRAGEILYTRIAPFTATVNGNVIPVYWYKFQINTYTEINSPGGNADRCKLTLHLGNGDTLVLPRVNGPQTSSSGECGGTRDGVDLNFTTHFNVYEGKYQYLNAGIYKVYMYDPNRNAGVVNVPSSVNQPFYLESYLVINNFTGANTAPEFTSPPLDDACFGICFYHNPGAFDIDGDSLSYAITESRGVDQVGNIGTPIPGYLWPNQVTSSGGTYSIDPISGTLAWCTPQKTGEYNLAFIVYEWRKNTAGKYSIIGYVLRDMQVKVVSCPNNLPPDITIPNDTCVVAGASITKTIRVTDGNGPNFVQLYGFGGPFTTSPAASISPNFTIASYTSTFQWSTNCGLIRRQPYQVTIKAEDQQSPVKLVVFKSFNIRVVPPAVTNVSATPLGSTIRITWTPSTCFTSANPIVRYEIFRKNDCVAPVYEPCKEGAPAGFVLTGTTTAAASQYTDTNGGQGLVVGQDYSYIVVAVYLDGSTSFGSTNVCTKLKRDVPILLNVDVLSTGTATGSIYVRWANPLANNGNLDTLVLNGPYTYNLLYKPVSASSYSVVHTVTQAQFYQLFNSASTTFTHTGINTVSGPIEYKVEFSSGTTTVGTSQRASSVFLTATGAERKIKLTWTSQTPWNNYKHTIYRKNPSQTTYTAIATTGSNTAYTDSINVANGSNYCYYILSEGKYSDPSIEDSLLNRSQEACATAVDITPPCAPSLTITSDCITGFIGLNWNNLTATCANDVIKYYLYKKETEDADYVLIDTLQGANSTAYQFDGLPDIAGCFAVAAVDSGGNVGNKSVDVCIDNCPEFELPNIITINGDGANDFFKAIKVRHIKEIDLYVYDRWGTLVYKTKDPLFKWDGTSIFSSRKVSDGTLFYICDVYEKRVKGIKKRSLKGWLQVVN